MDKLPSTQIGTIAGNQVADMLHDHDVRAAIGVPVRSDDDSIDLLIYDKNSGPSP